MKLKQIQEIASVTNLGAVRDEKQANQEQQRRDTDDQMFMKLDHAIAATIDYFINQQGMDQETAKDKVMDHLSDLVVAHDDIVDIG